MSKIIKILSQLEKKKQIEIGKKISYYSALIGGWINTRMEADKSILTLSVSAMGLLFTVLTTSAVKGTIVYGLFLLAILCFLFCAVITIKVFDKNADFLKSIAKNVDVSKDVRVLKKLDLFKSISFFIGLGITFLLSIILVIHKTNEDEMAKKGFSKVVTKTVIVTSKKSLQGFQDLKPSSGSTDSSKRTSEKKGK